MYRTIPTFSLAALLLIASGLLAFASSASGDELTVLLEEVRTGILDQVDSFAIDSCDPPCEGLICCDNHVCVHTVLACGMYPIHIDSFRVHGSPRSQMAGFATQGILAAEFGREAQLWFGQLDGEGWQERGIEPGFYELVLLEGAMMDYAVAAVVDGDGREVARLGGHFWVFSTATDDIGESATEPDWTLSADSLQFVACNDGRCLQLNFDLASD